MYGRRWKVSTAFQPSIPKLVISHDSDSELGSRVKREASGDSTDDEAEDSMDGLNRIVERDKEHGRRR